MYPFTSSSLLLIDGNGDAILDATGRGSSLARGIGLADGLDGDTILLLGELGEGLTGELTSTTLALLVRLLGLGDGLLIGGLIVELGLETRALGEPLLPLDLPEPGLLILGDDDANEPLDPLVNRETLLAMLDEPARGLERMDEMLLPPLATLDGVLLGVRDSV